MFDLGNEFDIDENFLDEVFQVEKAVKHLESTRKNDVSSNLDDTHLNILKETAINSTFLASSDSPQVSSLAQLRNRSIDNRNRSGDGRGTSSRKIIPRKFPGPAGLLPERQGNTSLIATEDFLNELEEESNDDSKFKEEAVLSQDSARGLDGPAWSELIRDLGPEGQALLKQVNVASVCSKAKQTRALKVPFLALIVQNIDASSADPCLYLSDTTGEMVGAVHREVWEQLGQDVVPGTVIVLINVGVLCAGHTTSRHYLNITSNNIAALYSPTDGSDIRVTNVKPLSQPDCSKFLRIWQELKSSVFTQSHSVGDNSHQRLLFSTATPSPRGAKRAQHGGGSNTHRFSTGSPINRSFDGSDSSHNIRFNSPSRCNGSAVDSSILFSPPPTNRTEFPSFRNNSPIPPHRPITSHIQSNNKLRNYPGSIRPHCLSSNETNPSIRPFTPKRPRYDNAQRSPAVELPFLSQENASQSVVENLLDGIDTDSLFGDF